MEHSNIGTMAEALDENKVWTPCQIVENSSDRVKVSFVGWGKEWDRYVSAAEIRPSIVDGRRKRTRHVTKNDPESYQIPKITKILGGDKLWIEEKQVVVKEVDPINNKVLVTIDDGNVWFPAEDLSTKKKLMKEKPKKQRNSLKSKEHLPQRTVNALCEESTNELSQEPIVNNIQTHELDFSVYIRQDGFVLKVGCVYLVDTLSCPVLLNRTFTRNSKVFVSVTRCGCDGCKIVSIVTDFVLTIDSSFVVRLLSSNEFNVSAVSQHISKCIFQCQSRVSKCQERNFGNVSYQRELRRHFMWAQIRQAVSSGISLNATRPAQPISLGVFDPFHDMATFGLSEGNNFKVSFSISEFSMLDKLCGKGWDVKPSLRCK